MNMKLLKLKRDRKRGCWTLEGYATTAPLTADLEDVKEGLARQIDNNPVVQWRLGILGTRSFGFRVVRT